MQLPSKKGWKINTVALGMCSLEKLGLGLRLDIVLQQKKVRIFFWRIRNVHSLFSKVDKIVSNHEIKIDEPIRDIHIKWSKNDKWTLYFVLNAVHHFGSDISNMVGPPKKQYFGIHTQKRLLYFVNTMNVSSLEIAGHYFRK